MIKTLAFMVTFTSLATANLLQASGQEKGDCATHLGRQSFHGEEDNRNKKSIIERFSYECKALTYPSDEKTMFGMGSIKTNEDGSRLMKECKPYVKTRDESFWLTCSSTKSMDGHTLIK